MTRGQGKKKPKIAKAQGRSVAEWIGKTPDSRPPKSVLLRIFRRADGVCHITGRKIQPGEEWDAEHVIRLDDGGENRESNLRPALRPAHRIKTAEENRAGKRADRVAMRHNGIKDEPKHPLKGKPFPKVEKTRPAGSKSDLSHLGPPAIARRFK